MDLPFLNAVLNSVSALLLLGGFISVKKGFVSIHKKFMGAALITSTAFLTSYLIHHSQVGSIPYPHHDWTRTLYFIILIPHVILAALMGPFIILTVVHALKGRIEKHKRIVKWLWPVWMYVSVTGVMVYWMLYRM